MIIQSNLPKATTHNVFKVVAYERWSLINMRAQTILGQNFSSLVHGNCRDLLQVLNVSFVHVKSEFQQKIRCTNRALNEKLACSQKEKKTICITS